MLTADYFAYDPATGTATVSVQLPRERVGITLHYTPAPSVLDLAAVLDAAEAQGIADGVLPADAVLEWAPTRAPEAE